MKFFRQKINGGKAVGMIFLSAIFFIHYFSYSTCAGGLVPCANDCNLCYLLVGISNIFQWLMGSLLGVTILLGITISGITFIISGAFPKALAFAKSSITSTAKGAFWALCGWLIINSIMNIVGYKNPQGGHWWQHECAGGTAQVAGNSGNGAINNNISGGAVNRTTACDPKNKKLESIKIQCAEKDFKLEGDGTGFYVVLDTLSEDDSGKTKQLKADAKYTCNGEASEEDVTAQAEWKASDETQIKVSKGVIAAVTTSLGSSSESVPYAEAKFQEKNSNTAKVYINSCPNTETSGASIETKNKFSLSENSLIIPKVNAQSWVCPNCKTPNELENSACKSCGQASTCHFVYGDPEAEFQFILIRGRRECSIGWPSSNDDSASPSEDYNPCDKETKKTWREGDQEGYEKFKKSVDAMSRGLDYGPFGKNDFSVYRSDLIADKDPTCPTPSHMKMRSYGYICNGTSSRGAFARQSEVKAKYCLDIRTPANVFAHEQIGHIIGNLDDEYEECGKNPNNFKSPHWNCTSKEKITPIYKQGLLWKSIAGYETKWGKQDKVWPGCLYSPVFLRSSENSIMRNSYSAKSFEKTNTDILKKRIRDFPNGPAWDEELKIMCSSK